MASKGIPFSLWNLFEDARIEHLERERSGEAFGWAQYEEPVLPKPGTYGAPCSEFFLLIQLENQNRKSRMPAVVEFYDRAIKAPSSLALLPILEDWIYRFGKEAPPERFSGEMQTGLNLQNGDLQVAEFEAGTFVPGAEPPKKPEAVKLTAKKRSKLLSENAEYVDFERAEKLAMKFLALFGARKITTRSNEPSARISTRHLELERPFYKRKSTVQATVKRLCLVVDCSGSMEGQPIEDARSLAWALSYLANLGKISGCLILSAVDEQQVALSEVFEFPLTKDVVAKIHAFGWAEGLNSAILNNHRALADADMVFVKTDGDICDEPLEQRVVQKKGITVCGLYSGGVNRAENMKDHFKRFFVRDSLEGLIDALLQSRIA